MGRKISYQLNENVFSELNNLSCYWAGFIAADGCVQFNGNKDKETRYFHFGLKEEDKYQVEALKSFICTNKELVKVKKEDFISYNLTLTSAKLCSDLRSNFNITVQKSLTLTFPNILNSYFKDCFILGYIDGDGSIFFHQRKIERAQPEIIISIIGTYEFLTVLRERFREILNREVGCIVRKRRNNKNTFVLSINGKSSREIFLHYYSLNVPKLKRKWTNDKYEFCNNWKRIPSRIKK